MLHNDNFGQNLILIVEKSVNKLPFFVKNIKKVNISIYLLFDLSYVTKER